MATNRHPMPHAHSWYDTPILGQPHQLRRLLRTPRTIPAQTFCPNVSAKSSDFNRPNRGCRVDRRLSSLPLRMRYFGPGGPTRKTRAAGQRHHVSLCQLLANACMAASRVGS